MQGELLDGGMVRTERCPSCGALRQVGAACGACGREDVSGRASTESAVAHAGAPLAQERAIPPRPSSTPLIAFLTVGVAFIGVLGLGLYMLFASGVGGVVTAASPQATLFRANLAGTQADLVGAQQDALISLAYLPETEMIDRELVTRSAGVFRAAYQEWSATEPPAALEGPYKEWLAGLAGLAEVGAMLEQALATDDHAGLFEAKMLLEERFGETSRSAEILLTPQGS